LRITSPSFKRGGVGRLRNTFSGIVLMAGVLGVSGCMTPLPLNLLQTPDNVLEKRQLQMRTYETADEEKVISASAGVLQDLGFTLDDSETKLGLVVGSKERDATEKSQVILATLATAFSSNQYGSYTNYYDTIDHIQKIQAAVVTKPSLSENKMTVRVTFQRLVWNKLGQINRIEAIKDPALYQGFFDKLSKAVFLEEQSL